MIIDSKKVEILVNSINEKHARKSYRELAKDYPAVIKAGTLCRIAKSKGKWLPKSRKILLALDLLVIVHVPLWMKVWKHLPTKERQQAIKDYLKTKETQNVRPNQKDIR